MECGLLGKVGSRVSQTPGQADAVSSLVWEGFGVVAGCPIAMSLMCLNLLEPFDQFLLQVPPELNELALYVDDFIMLFVLRECDVSQRDRVAAAIRGS